MISPQPKLSISPDTAALASAAADLIVREAADAVRSRGRFTLVLAGGHTPEQTYALLADGEGGRRLDWSTTWLFFGDERFVPQGDPRSNYALARRALLDRASVPPDHVAAIDTTADSPAAGAAAYAQRLAAFFAQPLDGQPPVFDLILLGLGDDGHTASLFPGAAALGERHAWVTWSPPGTLPPPVDRVTMTFPLLNAARHVVFLVSGTNKAEPLRDVLDGHATVERRPAAGIRPAAGDVTWLVDDAAASMLSAERR
ncbi:MAG: 6-phosphogluconolactonase [Planctomycetia bacterium]|nr:6-phosphogluconolactonase [Planctomycetia bacterium]